MFTHILSPTLHGFQIRRLCPMQKLGTTENVAALVSYLASDEADFMTGEHWCY